jgi:choline-sulfatase
MKPTNVLFLMSDEHNKSVLGHSGNPIVRTPNLDALAAGGTVFRNAYTTCPICIPARASLHTGRYVNRLRNWSNGEPYCGQVPGWAHRLRDSGHQAVSVGKLHFRKTEDDNGFNEEILPMHVVRGIGDLHGCIRRPPPPRPSIARLAKEVGFGVSDYTRYDEAITKQACKWLREQAPLYSEKPWTLFVSWARPHFPLIAPEKYRAIYPPDDFPLDLHRKVLEPPIHPVVQALRSAQNYEDFFVDEDNMRMAMSAYYGMVSAMDEQVGHVLAALQETGAVDDTTIIYTSDHGDNLGNRKFWGKSNMYEDSVAVPMLVSGPDVPCGHEVEMPVSLIDVYPTILGAAHVDLTDYERETLPGCSLVEIANGNENERTILSEYHAVGAITGMFMIRFGQWKYIHYEGYPPQLFDLASDPLEATDLGESQAHSQILAECDRRLRAIVNPEVANRQAFADQAALIERNGGIDAIMSAGEFPHTPIPLS